MNFTEHNADYWIEKLELTPHPEGGYYRETIVADDEISTSVLDRYNSEPRKAYTLIYYLLKSGQSSKLHRLKSDEIWNFYAGSSLSIHVIDAAGDYTEKRLGANIHAGESFQHVVKHGAWFGADLNAKNSYALVGCFVAPGFDFKDFEMGEKSRLVHSYPQHMDIIEKLMG